MDFAAVVDGAPDALLGLDEQGAIVLANARAEILFGASRDELLGRPIADLLPGALQEVLADQPPAGRTLVEYLAAASVRLPARRVDGTDFSAEIRAAVLPEGAGPRLLIAVRDGTGQTFDAVVASTSTAIVTKTLDGIITSWNRAAELQTGFTAAEVVGRSIELVLPPDRIEEERSLRERVAAGEEVGEVETVRLRRDGGEVHLSSRMSPMVDASGQVIGVTTVAHDITALKRAEAERERLLERLHQSQRLESLGQLAGGIAHDFNNLLAVILGYVGFVAEALEGNEAARADLAEIRAAAERASRLTQQLLIFGRRGSVHGETVDLNGVVNDVRRMLSRTLGAHVDLVVRCEPDLPKVKIDRGRLEQVLVNLAVNARDAMPDGGTLAIETRRAYLDEELVRGHPGAEPGSYVQLSVSDTGVGMSKDVLSRVLEPFFTTKPTGVGTGLGLPTVYGIVRDARGALTLYSEEGLGTTVSIHLPIAEEPASASGQGRRTEAAPVGAGETILLVEDEDAVRAVAGRILRDHGYRVVEARSPDQALALAQEHQVDLLLSDVVLPHMSGPELAGVLDKIRPGLPVLFMSGYSQGVLGTGHALAAEHMVLQKPFHEHALLTRIHAALHPAAAEPRTAQRDAS